MTMWIWILAGGAAWLALLTMVVALCVAAGRADRAAERAEATRTPDVRARRFARRQPPAAARQTRANVIG
jgi:hypothetical protein